MSLVYVLIHHGTINIQTPTRQCEPSLQLFSSVLLCCFTAYHWNKSHWLCYNKTSLNGSMATMMKTRKSFFTGWEELQEVIVLPKANVVRVGQVQQTMFCLWKQSVDLALACILPAQNWGIQKAMKQGAKSGNKHTWLAHTNKNSASLCYIINLKEAENCPTLKEVGDKIHSFLQDPFDIFM